MNEPKKRRAAKSEPDELPLSINALASLTRSDVIEQVKIGLSRIDPDDDQTSFAGLSRLDSTDQDEISSEIPY